MMGFNMPAYKDTKQLILMAFVGGVGLLYLYVHYLLLPQVTGVVKIYSKARRVSVEFKNNQRDVSEIPFLKKEVEAYRGRIDSYERMLPVEQEIPKLLESLSNTAKASGVKIVGITPLQSKQEANPEQIYQEIPILINAKSGYHELGKFISDLENSDRFTKVADIKIKAGGLTPKRHDVELLVLTYMLLKDR